MFLFSWTIFIQRCCFFVIKLTFFSWLCPFTLNSNKLAFVQHQGSFYTAAGILVWSYVTPCCIMGELVCFQNNNGGWAFACLLRRDLDSSKVVVHRVQHVDYVDLVSCKQRNKTHVGGETRRCLRKTCINFTSSCAGVIKICPTLSEFSTIVQDDSWKQEVLLIA